jgi:hypothetical protein
MLKNIKIIIIVDNQILHNYGFFNFSENRYQDYIAVEKPIDYHEHLLLHLHINIEEDN